MRKVSLVVLGAVIGAVTVTVGTQTRLLAGGSARAAASDTYKSLNLFGDVFEHVRTDYVEQPDEQKLIEAAINGMIGSLDPHSSYMDAKAFSDMQVETSGQFGGLGIEVSQENGALKVVSAIDDTPASRAGILSGDIISAINGTTTDGMPLDQAVNKMRGDINTPITLTITRGTTKKDYTLTRATIQIKSVNYHEIDNDIGYIRISQFNEQTYDGLKEAMAKFASDIPDANFKGYILDLRNNPGGLLDQSIEVVNTFVNHGEIVSTRGRNADETQRYDARPSDDLSHGKPLMILIDGGSASASEIVAGALQDHKRGTIIGTRSFGKGSVQTIIPLGEGNGALRLTTARYYTPSGRSIQAEGIEPDIVVVEDVPPDLVGKDVAPGESSLKGHLLNGTTTGEENGSQAYVPPDATKDKQLIEATDLLNGDTAAAAALVQTTSAAATPAPAPATTAPAAAAPAAAAPVPTTPTTADPTIPAPPSNPQKVPN